MTTNYSGQTRRQGAVTAPHAPLNALNRAGKTQVNASSRALSAFALTDNQLDQVVGGVAMIPKKPALIL